MDKVVQERNQPYPRSPLVQCPKHKYLTLIWLVVPGYLLGTTRPPPTDSDHLLLVCSLITVGRQTSVGSSLAHW
jgi:hypothetical protein